MAGKTNQSSKQVAAGKAEPSPFAPAQIKKFVGEVQAEFSKITWPDKKVTLGLTGMVVLLTIIVSIYLGAVDVILGKLLSLILR